MRNPQSKYGYCSRNLHSEPERYRFSKTGGASYIRSFLELRKKKVGEIRNVLGNPSSLSSLGTLYPMFADLCSLEEGLQEWLSFFPQKNVPRPQEFPPDCKKFTTRQVVSLIILKLLEGKIKEPKERLDLLIKKFEVFRKIQTTYDNSFKKIGEDADNMALYAYFSLALLLSYSKWMSLKSLNTALKINDMLTTHEFSSDSYDTMVLSCAAIQWESLLVLRLANEQGINP